MEYLIHVANVLYLFSYSVKDIFILRSLTVVGAFVLMPFFYFQPRPIWAAIGWNVLFTGINCYRIYLLHLERRPIHFPEKESRLYKTVFQALTPHEFSKLLKIGGWGSAQPQEQLVKENSVFDKLMLINSGHVSVRTKEKTRDELKEGQFIGETSLFTDEPTKADVVAEEPTEYIAWPNTELKKLFKDEPNLRASVQTVISRDLVRKLRQVQSSTG